VGVFVDRGITGTTENRPEFQRMLVLAREGKIDLIITKSISRLGRNTALVLKAVRELKNIGVEVRFEKENIETMSGDGELMLTVLSSFAQEESKNVSDNLKWRVRRKFERGELMINTTRFLGYDKDEYGDLVINPAEAEIIKRIYKEYLSGNGAFKIAKLLDLEDIPTVTGTKLNEATVRQILKSEKYKGDVVLQKTFTENHLSKKKKKNKGELDSFYIENNHSPIISRKMWKEVQEEMQKRAEAKGNFKGSDKCQNRYPLIGMLYCSKCGASLRRRTWNSKFYYRKIKWQCSNYIKNGKGACSGTSIDDEVISRLNIKEEIIVEEEIRDGKKYYSYSSKSRQNQSCRELRTTEKKEWQHTAECRQTN
jgi:site-specific DNA recombinase